MVLTSFFLSEFGGACNAGITQAKEIVCLGIYPQRKRKCGVSWYILNPILHHPVHSLD